MAENQWISLGVISPRNKWSYGTRDWMVGAHLVGIVRGKTPIMLDEFRKFWLLVEFPKILKILKNKIK